MRNGIFKYIFIIFVIILIIVTCVKFLNSEESTNKEDLDQTSKSNLIQTDLRLAIAGFDCLNPLISNNKNVQEISKIIYESLVTFNSELKLENCLAKEIAKKDNNNYIVKLREDVRFQDGSKLTSEDVKFTIDVIKLSGINTRYSENLESVTSVNKIDDYTIQITLDKPIPFFEYYLTFPIMSSEYYENEDFATSEKHNMAVGTGKFSVEAIDGNVIKLLRNEDYWNKEKIPMVKEVYINLYGTIGEVYEAFKNGNLDVLNVSTTNIESYIGNLGYTKLEYKTRNYDFISFNTQSALFSDPAVRKAISLIIDKSSVIASSLGNGFTPSNFSLDMGSWLYSDDINIGPDLDQAKQILLNSGWEYKNNSWSKIMDGKLQNLEFTIIVNSSNDFRKNAINNVIEQLGNFGIIVYQKQVSPDNYSNILANKSYDAVITGIECGYSPNLETFFGENNLANYSNEEMRQLLLEVSNTSDEKVLKEKYNRIYEIYLEEVPYFGLYRETDYVIYNQGLVGNLKPNSFNIFQNIEKWYRQ